LVSLTFSHHTDNTEGITYVIRRKEGDTIYRLNAFLNGYVALSTDGLTVAHLITEKQGRPLNGSIISFYRSGKKEGDAELHRFIKYHLDERTNAGKIPTSRWLRNDSLLHRMATNPFHITEDKLYLSFDRPLLMVFDMNRMFHIYTGNGANHFLQNYYSIPNAPFRVEYSSSEYSPKGFPSTSDGRTFDELISHSIKGNITNEKNARTKVWIDFKLLYNGSIIIRNIEVRSIVKDEPKVKELKLLEAVLSETSFSTELLPPDHPTWIFSGTFRLR